jgi:hypothetical protein
MASSYICFVVDIISAFEEYDSLEISPVPPSTALVLAREQMRGRPDIGTCTDL